MADKDYNITYNRETKVVNASFLEHVRELRQVERCRDHGTRYKM